MVIVSSRPANSPRQRALVLAALVAVALAALCAACGGEAIDLTLVPDPNINPRAQLVEELASVRLILDADGGLYSDQHEQRIAANVVIRDVDGDGFVELVADLDVAKRGRLPTIRLARERLGVKPFDVRLRGLSRDSSPVEIAAGGVDGVRFTPEKQALDVPFNLKPAYRPPRVTQTIPADGASVEVSDVGSVFVVFSKRMDAKSLRAAGTLQLLSVVGGQEQLIPFDEILVQTLLSDVLPTTVEYRLKNPLSAGKYAIRVSNAAKDATAQHMQLDQVVMRAGAQPFSASFEVTGALPARTCMGCPPVSALFCHDGGDGCPGQRMTCDKKAKRCVLKSCPKSCPKGTVCDPKLELCVDDCRINGTYGGCASGASCGRDGLCVGG